MEVVGVIGIIGLLTALAIPIFRTSGDAAQLAAAKYNANVLNMSLDKFNLSGISVQDTLNPSSLRVLNMTADVIRPVDVVGLDESQLPETLVCGMLASEFMFAQRSYGPFLPPYLKPQFATADQLGLNTPRVVWVNGLSDSDPGRFEAVGKGLTFTNPDGSTVSMAAHLGLPADVPGIIGLSRDGIETALVGSSMVQTGGRAGIDATYGESVPEPSTYYTLTLSAFNPSEGTVSPTNSSGEQAQIDYSATPNLGYVFSHWDGALTGQPASGSISPGQMPFPTNSNKQARAYFKSAGSVPVTITVEPLEGGSVSGAGDYPLYQLSPVNIEAIPNDGWVFDGWTGDVESTVPSMSFTPQEMYAACQTVTLTAHFSQISEPSLAVSAPPAPPEPAP